MSGDREFDQPSWVDDDDTEDGESVHSWVAGTAGDGGVDDDNLRLLQAVGGGAGSLARAWGRSDGAGLAGAASWANPLQDLMRPLTESIDILGATRASASIGDVLSKSVTQGITGRLADLLGPTAAFDTMPLSTVPGMTQRHVGMESMLGSFPTMVNFPATRMLDSVRDLSPPVSLNFLTDQSPGYDLFRPGRAAYEHVQLLEEQTRAWETIASPTRPFGLSDSLADLSRTLMEPIYAQPGLTAAMLAGLPSSMNLLGGLPGYDKMLGFSAAAMTTPSIWDGLVAMGGLGWASSGDPATPGLFATLGDTVDEQVASEGDRLISERAAAILQDADLFSQFEQQSGLPPSADPVAKTVHARARLVRLAQRAAHSRAARITLATPLVWTHANVPELYDWAAEEAGFWGFLIAVAIRARKGQ